MTMKLSDKIALITNGTSGIGLEAAKRWCMDLWFLKASFGLPEIGNPDAVKAIEEEAACNCSLDEDSQSKEQAMCAFAVESFGEAPATHNLPIPATDGAFSKRDARRHLALLLAPD
jgi:NAD(P)-dependent dehydrogenase (short-subunit alcohol dehydrogenase family)